MGSLYHGLRCTTNTLIRVTLTLILILVFESPFGCYSGQFCLLGSTLPLSQPISFLIKGGG